MSIEILAGMQNRDGGWPYAHGASWTETTVYAVGAMLASGEVAAARRGIAWLQKAQRPDGSWPPRPGVDESAWVTAPVALLPAELVGAAAHARAIHWLLDTKGEESTFLQWLRQRLAGAKATPESEYPGWPWLPGSAAWVAPTAIAILALQKAERRGSTPEVRKRIDSGREFLLRRTCRGGGWNHGSVRALGYESGPYPETTGLALAALGGVPPQVLAPSLELASRFLEQCRSACARNWLRLGLTMHGRLPAGVAPPAGTGHRTIQDLSLEVLVEAAVEKRDRFFA